MLIRFLKLTQDGVIQIQAGELLDLPSSLAQKHIDDGNAVAVNKAEYATMPRHEFASPIPNAAAKGRSKLFRGRR